MGTRGKFITDDTAVPLPLWFDKKYKENYYIGKLSRKPVINISSKKESNDHEEIINDLKSIANDKYIRAAILWEDGTITRITLSNESIFNDDACKHCGRTKLQTATEYMNQVFDTLWIKELP